jgi:cytochrome c peroxidase
MDWLRGRVAALVAMVGLAAVAVPATAHIVREEPWHPVAAAYRTSLFLADLTPVPWEAVEAAWTQPIAASVAADPPLARLPQASSALAEAIRSAIGGRDRQALYESATRATSATLRAALAEAEAALEGGEPLAALNRAKAIWRVFDSFVAEADPAGWRRLGRAWLDLYDSAGSRGLTGAGRIEPDRARFVAARAEVEAYLRANFEPERFTPRSRLTPLPETVVAERGEIEVAPWLPPGSFIGDQTPLPRLVLNFEEQGIDETGLPLIAYGDMLFDSPEIFGEPARSLGIACSTCHNRSDINRDFFIPGVSHQRGAADVDGSFFNPLFNDRRADPLDIPSLRGLRFTGPYGRDGRFASLREFTRNVIVNEFAGAEPTPFMLDALVAYMFEFDFLPNAKLTPDGRLTEAAPEAARRGEEIFKRPFAQIDGKACATCHVPSANFLDRRAHDIGSGGEAYAGARGGAFDTPTLLGTRFTAPYFHDGSLPTLASVVDWFDGRYALGLSEAERADLTAYLEAVGDADEPYEPFGERNTPFRLAFEELTTFASTLDTLIPARDAFHAQLLIDTVAADLAADASAMANLAAKPEVYALAAILEEVGAVIAAGDWKAAEARWAAFKARQTEIDARMF